MNRYFSLLCSLLLILSCTDSKQNNDGNSSSNVRLTVDATETISPLKITLGAQLDDWVLYQELKAANRLKEIHPSWFRIHAGADVGVLPEILEAENWGRWDFNGLDNLVKIAAETGAKAILNIRHAPVTLSSCSEFKSAAGSLLEANYRGFADYMSKLVAYYNLGAFDDNGIIYNNPFGKSNRVDYWEVWNEPDLAYEFPCIVPEDKPVLSPDEYNAMLEIVSTAMLNIDPTIKIIAPAVSDPRNIKYTKLLLDSQRVSLYGISMHGYAGANSASDSELITGGVAGIGLNGIVNGVLSQISLVDSNNKTAMPIFLDEFNISPDGFDDPLMRGWNGFGVALNTSLFIRLATLPGDHPIVFLPFQFIEGSGLRLTSIDWRTGESMLPYWKDLLLSKAIGDGGDILQASSNSSQIDVLATLSSNKDKIHILISNFSGRFGSKQDNLNIDLRGLRSGMVESATIEFVDDDTDRNAGPRKSEIFYNNGFDIAFSGVGAALITVTLH
ncbi:MAG: hypothetical protein H7A00_00110 [Hahellaceae bacterium]|nr:hypothetical protein [Hahellaceae bacterium]